MENPEMVQMHSTTVQMTNSAPPPKDFLVWSIYSLVYWNPCCLGLAALIFSVRSRDRKVTGDLEGARHYGRKACYLNITALLLIVLVLIIIIASHSAIIAAIVRLININMPK